MSIKIQRPVLRRERPVLRVAARPFASLKFPVRTARLIVTQPALRVTPILAPTEAPNLSPDPYVDYGRWLTPQGGVLIVYKDHDERLRYTLRRLFLWSLATGIEAWYLFTYSPAPVPWINLACLLAVAIVNWLIVKKPVEIYRSIEVRPDCIILDESDVFWARNMENGAPTFRQDEKGNHILCGIYGTRFVDYATLRRFDEFDRMAEVFAAHIQDAMQQLWSRTP